LVFSSSFELRKLSPS